ncbi:MAG: hypothetical protein R3C18_07015 [Planctomycetaceae bacterium]
MSVILTAFHDDAQCTWCEKSKECVTVDFGSTGFIRNQELCFGCLQKALRVQARQESKSPRNKPASP